MTGVRSIEAATFPVPFRAAFRHASASRAEAANVIVAARSHGGAVGYGEGCPRPYVSGETVASAAAFVRAHAAELAADVRDAPTLRAWAESRRAEIDRNPAAFCAVELALLDLFGKEAGAPVEALLGLPPLAGRFPYTAVLGDAPRLVYWWQLRRYRRRGFRDYKVKATGDLGRDRWRLRQFAGSEARVRVDANNLWESADVCIRHVQALQLRLYAIEEPLRQDDLAGFARVGEECAARIILDESLLRAAQLDGLGGGGRWIANVRVSKMGGILRSLEAAERAAALGIPVIVGAQVGETSILTRAGLTAMLAAGPNLDASEGAFGTHLLRRDLTRASLMFGDDGAVNADREGLGAAPGLGLAVREDALAPLP